MSNHVPAAEIGPNDALAMPGALLLDVRELYEWEAGHAPEAEHLPMGEVRADHPLLADRQRPIVCICRSGARSRRVAEVLVGAGWPAVNMAGGMKAWDAAGLPVVNEAGTPGSIV
jgi:rhodanese-related sulfurtransferase